MRILVTGSRNHAWGTVWAALDQALAAHGPFTLVVGDCLTGADHWASDWARRTDTPVEIHTADWRAHDKKAGPMRNQEMVDSGADLCLAFPLGRSVGTRDCMRRAAAAGIPVQEHQLAVTE